MDSCIPLDSGKPSDAVRVSNDADGERCVDARRKRRVRADRSQLSVPELRTPAWRRVESYPSQHASHWSNALGGCVRGHLFEIQRRRALLQSHADGNAEKNRDGNSQNMGFVTAPHNPDTARILCIILRCILDTDRLEAAFRGCAAVESASRHVSMRPAPAQSRYASVRTSIKSAFLAMLSYADSLHEHVNVRITHTELRVTDLLRFPFEDMPYEDATFMRRAFESKTSQSFAFSNDSSRFGFCAHTEAVSIVKRAPLLHILFNMFISYRVASFGFSQKAYSFQMHAFLTSVARSCNHAALLRLAEETDYRHLEDPYPVASLDDATDEREACMRTWTLRRERVQHLYATSRPLKAQVRMMRRIAAGTLRILVSETLHDAMHALVQGATPRSDVDGATAPIRATVVVGGSTGCVRVTDVVIATLAVVNDAHQIIQTNTNVIERWKNARVPHVVLCAALAFLTRRRRQCDSADVWTAMLDVCVVNGAEKDDIISTIPYLSPFHLPEVGFERASECQGAWDILVARTVHVLTVVSMLQRHPHAYAVSLATWVYVSLRMTNGLGIDPTLMNCQYMADVVNECIAFEPIPSLEPLARRVIESMKEHATRHWLDSAECAHGPAKRMTRRAIPLECCMDIHEVCRRAAQLGEAALCALVYAEPAYASGRDVRTYVFEAAHVSTFDTTESWRALCDECILHGAEAFVRNVSTPSPLEFEMDGKTYWIMTKRASDAYALVSPLMQAHSSPLVRSWENAAQAWTTPELQPLVVSWLAKRASISLSTDEILASMDTFRCALETAKATSDVYESLQTMRQTKALMKCPRDFNPQCKASDCLRSSLAEVDTIDTLIEATILLCDENSNERDCAWLQTTPLFFNALSLFSSLERTLV
jgi:hypothetical protein